MSKKLFKFNHLLQIKSRWRERGCTAKLTKRKRNEPSKQVEIGGTWHSMVAMWRELGGVDHSTVPTTVPINLLSRSMVKHGHPLPRRAWHTIQYPPHFSIKIFSFKKNKIISAKEPSALPKKKKKKKLLTQ